MKFVTLATVVLASMMAQATPKVGDKIAYNITITNPTSTSSGTLMFELTAYDLASDMWTKTTQISIAENNNQSSEQVSSKELLSDEIIQNVLANCAQSNGRNEAVQTHMGAMNTCALDFQQDSSKTTSWVGAVPMGLVQFQTVTQDGSSSMGTVSSFTNGN